MDNLCKDCGINPAPNHEYYGLCPSCRAQKYSYSKDRQCIDCGAKVSNRAARCIHCRNKYLSHKLLITCELCGDQVYVKRSAVYRKGVFNGGKYCSVRCRRKVWAAEASKRGKEANAWKDGPTIHTDGYIDVWDEERGRRIHEHTLKAEKVLGRRLKKGEVVHHINLDKSDNRNCNLLICTQSYHRWLHHQMELAWVKSHPELLKSS